MIASLRTKLIDRFLWYRHCGWFNFSHKPLCSHYSYGVLRLGKLAVCRSCSLVYLIGGITAITLALTSGWRTGLFPPILLLLSLGIVALSYPPLYKRLPRLVNDLLRSGLGAVVTATGLGFHAFGLDPLLLANVALLTAMWLVYGRIRQGSKRSQCDTCPDNIDGQICPGYTAQAVSIRKYQDEFAAYLTKKAPPF